MKRIALGRHVLGLAAIGLGVIALIWHDPNHWQQLVSLKKLPHREVLVYLAAAIEICGGIALQWPKTARPGAVALGTLDLIFALLLLPAALAKPGELYRWLNCFYQVSLVGAAMIVYATARGSDSKRATRTARIGCILFAISLVSFAVEQVVFLSVTSGLVPRWLPPGQMFWAIATTIAFALAGLAILSGRSALLAARCLTAMLAGFLLLVWLPACSADPHRFSNWSEGGETLAITGAAWVIADYFSRKRPTSRS